MDFQTLTEGQFSTFTEDQFATFLESGGTSGTTCLYDPTAIAAIKSVVDGLATAIAALTNQVNTLQSDITAIKARMPQTGTVSTLTASDVWNYSRDTYDTIFSELLSAKTLVNYIYTRMPQTGTVSTLTAYDVWYTQPYDPMSAGELTPMNYLFTTTKWGQLHNVATVVDSIKAKTDNLPASPAATSDVQITVNADGINVPTVAEIWSHTNRTLTSGIPTVSAIQSGLAKTSDIPTDYAKPGDAMTLTTAYDAAKTAAQPSDVQLSTITETVNVTTQTVDISGLATAANLSSLQTTANAIKTQTDKIPSTSLTPSDLTALRTHGDSNWATATGFATPEDVSTTDLSQVYSALNHITALLDHWTVTGNVLTTYDDSGAVLKTYALTRDSNNNITSIQEAE